MDTRQKLTFVDRVPLFALLDARTRSTLAKRLRTRIVAFGEPVFAEGDAGDAMYVVVSGRARVTTVNAAGEEVSLAVLGPGDHFGEGALLFGAARSASVRAADDLVLLGLGREEFERQLAGRPAVRTALHRFIAETGVQNFLKQYTALGTLSSVVLRSLIGELEEVHAAAGHIVVREGAVGDRFYIVRRGALEVIRGTGDREAIVGQIGEGEFFGELALLSGAPRAATVRARTDCDLYALSKAGFDRAVAASPEFRAHLEERAALYRAAATAADSGRAAPAAARPPAADIEEDETPEGVPPKAPWWRRALRRYPSLRQHDQTDCGAASLAMITAYYGVPVGLARLRDLANVDADGASLWSLAQAAEVLGFHARGLQVSYDALADVTLPAIVHWEGYHYIVLYRVGRRHVVVGDPALGLRRLSVDEFRNGWTGRALEMIPTSRLRSTERLAGTYHRFWPILRPSLALLAEVLAASLVLNLLGLGIPLFTQTVVDRVLVRRSVDLLNLMLGGMLMVALFQAIISAVRRVLLVHISTRADARLLGDFLGHVMSLPMRFFDVRKVGDIISRVAENEKLQAVMVGTIPGVLLDLLLALGYLALMAFYNIRLTLMVLAVVPLFAVLLLAFTPAIRRNRRQYFNRYALAWSYLIESVTGIATVKAMAVELRVRSRLESLFVDSLLAGRKGAQIDTAYATLSTFVQTVGTTLFLWYGAQQVLDGQLSIGQLLAFTTLAASIMAPVVRLVDAWDALQDARIAVERLNDVFDARPEEAVSRELLNPPRIEGRIRFENVSFKYARNQDKPTLAGISIEISPGERVALVGRSGSGKSTLAKLILGLYPPTSGRVLIDGHDLRVLSKRTLRRRIGIVPQEVFLFSGTIRENIALGDADARFEDVVSAAKMGGAHAFISDMAMGYDTKVGERGMSLSGGQRQRIALARALLHDPDVLLLDEATSALDTESERAIRHSLEEATRHRTTLIIAHRLSTVQHADRILVLDAGAIVEEGTHQQLLDRGALYAHLVGQQVTE
ncbi:MAG: cyclic nucleotide-binding domain-containing protein [Alphaproteobacteria bacterium]|nr:cyclic nucleotide-binding domain-containing protein [Alphaproteobacteria bacterium]